MNDKLFKFLWLTFRRIKNNKFKGAGFCPEKFEYFAFAKQIFDKSIPVNLDLIVRISLLQKLQKDLTISLNVLAFVFLSSADMLEDCLN